jgi:hypothetical protein
MFSRIFFAFLASCLAVPASADDAQFIAERAANIERVAHTLDVRSNAGLLRKPGQALEWIDAVTEPGFAAALMSMSAHPETWLKAIEQAAEPSTLKNFSQASDPQVLADWFYSSIDPTFQHALLSRALDPAKARRWLSAVSDPRFYAPAIAVMTPATPLEWVQVTADGRVLRPLAAWLDPKNALGWLRLPAELAAARADKPVPEPWLKRLPQRY